MHSCIIFVLKTSGKATISNDGATIINLLDVVHPAAKSLVDIAKSQDAEVIDSLRSTVYNIVRRLFFLRVGPVKVLANFQQNNRM